MSHISATTGLHRRAPVLSSSPTPEPASASQPLDRADIQSAKVDKCPYLVQAESSGIAREEASKKVGGSCPFLKSRDHQDVNGLLDCAKQTMKQQTFGDQSFQAARDTLEEALGIQPEDPTGEINGLLGKSHYLEQHWGDACKHLRIARERDPKNPYYQEIYDRSQRNIVTRVDRPMAEVKYFDGPALLSPPAQHLRAPHDWQKPAEPGMGAKVAAAADHCARQAAGTVLGGLLHGGLRVVSHTHPYEVEGSPWTQWDKHKGSLPQELIGTAMLANMREEMNAIGTGTLASTYAGGLVGFQQPGQLRPEWTLHARTANGSWNTDNPMEGAAGTEFQFQGRGAEQAARDRSADPGLPTGRAVSRALLHATGEQKKVPFLNMLAMSWIQFMSHDWMSHGENMAGEVRAIPLESDDPWREKYQQDKTFLRKTQLNPTRHDAQGKPLYLNEVTHWWDGSQIYGSDQQTVDRLRTGPDGVTLKDGKLAINSDGTLPINPNTGNSDSGFTRNWWVGLEVFHTLFVKNHNDICEQLKAAPECQGWGSDQMFETARLVNAAVMAKIHTVEWTPAVLPNPKLVTAMNTNWFGGIEAFAKKFGARMARSWRDVENPILGGLVGGKRDNHGMPYGFSEKFVEVYRLHAGLAESLEIRKIGSEEVVQQVATDLTRGAGARKLVRDLGMAEILNSLGHQHMGALVNNNYSGPMAEMAIEGQSVIDLGSIDVERARERGVPPYNEFRTQMGLKPLADFKELFVDPDTQESRQTLAKLEKLYGSGKEGVDKMDLLVGTLCEAVRPEYFGFGETLFQIFIQMASRRLEADPWYTERFDEAHYTKTGMEIINRANLRDLMIHHYPELGHSGLEKLNNAFEPAGTTALTHPEEHPLTAFAEKYAEDHSLKGGPIRVTHTETGQRFVVEGSSVYADGNGDGLIARSEAVSAPIPGVDTSDLIEGAGYLSGTFEPSARGGKTPDGAFVSGGQLNRPEVQAFADQGVPLQRSDLKAHLDFFDTDRNGRASTKEMFQGMRSLGYGLLPATFVAGASTLLFALKGGSTSVDIENIGKVRPADPTEIYDQNGNINHELLNQYASEFDRPGHKGVLSFDEFKSMLAEKKALGLVPKRQFSTLTKLCRRLNGSDTITKQQFIGLFDSSLLYQAKQIKREDS